MDRQLRALLVETAQHAQANGRSVGGDESWGAAVPIRCRIEQSRKRLLGPNGEEIQANAQLYTEAAVQVGDRLWLPGADVAHLEESFEARHVETFRHPNGAVSHYRVTI